MIARFGFTKDLECTQQYVPMETYLKHRKVFFWDGWAFGFVVGVFATLGTAWVVYQMTK